MNKEYTWAEQEAFEQSLANEWEELFQELGFERGSMNSSILLFMRDELEIKPIPENYMFIQKRVLGIGGD